MTDALNVFWDGEQVGTFTRDSEGISFRYTSTATRPISLSLPLTGEWSRKAPETFLDNLLPDNHDVRLLLAEHLNTTTEPFNLLSHIGEDVAGALVLLPEGRRAKEAPDMVRITPSHMALQVASLSISKTAWFDPDNIGNVRMSLAGFQGKFTAHQLVDGWAWSSATIPSTHIFKPEPRGLPGLASLEAGALKLANLCGVEAANAEVYEFGRTKCLVVERFDRERIGRDVQRIHAEDLIQALGRDSESKYQVTLEDVAGLLQTHVGQSAAKAFFEQLAFNVALGNVDAHGKNYTILLDGTPTLAPLYDAVPIRVWPQFNAKLAMKIGHAITPTAVQLSDWEYAAKQCGMNPDEIVAKAQEIATKVNELAPQIWPEGSIDSKIRERLLRTIHLNTAKWRLGTLADASATTAARIIAIGTTPKATSLSRNRPLEMKPQLGQQQERPYTYGQ